MRVSPDAGRAHSWLATTDGVRSKESPAGGLRGASYEGGESLLRWKHLATSLLGDGETLRIVSRAGHRVPAAGASKLLRQSFPPITRPGSNGDIGARANGRSTRQPTKGPLARSIARNAMHEGPSCGAALLLGGRLKMWPPQGGLRRPAPTLVRQLLAPMPRPPRQNLRVKRLLLALSGIKPSVVSRLKQRRIDKVGAVTGVTRRQ
jgi:hypothetical protein